MAGRKSRRLFHSLTYLDISTLGGPAKGGVLLHPVLENPSALGKQEMIHGGKGFAKRLDIASSGATKLSTPYLHTSP